MHTAFEIAAACCVAYSTTASTGCRDEIFRLRGTELLGETSPPWASARCSFQHASGDKKRERPRISEKTPLKLEGFEELFRHEIHESLSFNSDAILCLVVKVFQSPFKHRHMELVLF